MDDGEKLNSITHLIGAASALVGLGALLTVSVSHRDPWMIASFAVFGCSLILLYTMSTLYHGLHAERWKKLFQKLDHVSIYLLIAGTYTPYMLVSLRDGRGPSMMAAVWGLAALGVGLELFSRRRRVAMSLVIYLVMGWVSVLEYANLQAALSPAGATWLAAGGVAYTIGVVFYVMDKKKRLRHAHGIWHVFVLLGSACHFVSVIAYVR